MNFKQENYVGWARFFGTGSGGKGVYEFLSFDEINNNSMKEGRRKTEQKRSLFCLL